MESGSRRFSTIGVLVGVMVFAGSAWAQQASSNLPFDQLTAAMMGQADPADLTAPKPLLGFLEGIQTKGYVNVGFTHNLNDSENRNNTGPENPGRVFDVFHNEFTVHNVALYLQKPVDNENWVGFSFVPTFGKDGSVTQESNISFGGNDMDILEANVQLYVPDEIAMFGGTTFTMGKFITSAGGEVIDAPYNDMFSRSLLFGFAIPFVHTGLKADKTLIQRSDEGDLLGVSLGVANGWGNHLVGSAGGPATPTGTPAVPPRSNGNFPTWLMTASITPGGAWDPQLTVNNFVGETSSSGEYRNLLDVVASISPVEDVTLSANADWVTDQIGRVRVKNGRTGGYAELYGLAAILRYDFGLMSTEKNWYLAFRGEYFDDRDGFALGVAGLDVFDLTWTLGFKPTNNLLLRAEVRYDKADVAGSATSDVFENGDSNNQTTLSFDASFLF